MKRITLLILLVVGVFFLLILLGAGLGIRHLVLETGNYESGHGFRIDGKAYRAIQEAQKLKPGTHLVVQTQRSFVGPELYTEIHFAKEFRADDDFVTITTRGVNIEVEQYLYERRVLWPIISHTGNEPTTGYTLTYTR